MGKNTYLQEYESAKDQLEGANEDFYKAIEKWRKDCKSAQKQVDLLLANSELNISSSMNIFWQNRFIIAQNELMLTKKEVDDAS